MSRDAIRSILVVGDGVVGLSAALAFSRALSGVDVSLLRLPADPAAIADHFPATLPAIGRFHASIGFDELDLVRRGIAVHHLGTHFDDGAAGTWTHSFGEVGRGEGMVPFHQLWRGASQAGSALAFDRYSPASVIGGAGKFVHPSGDPASPLATFLYGLRLHPDRYRAALEAATRELPKIEGEIATVERRDDSAIAALSLKDGRIVEADLYVDCSGPAAILNRALSDDFEDWSAWLPATHVSAVWDDQSPLHSLDRVTAIDQGWRMTATVPGATLRADVTTEATSSSTAVRPGRRHSAFLANVLAIGDSAVALDPLHGSTLSLAHSAILRAIALIPGRDCHPLELAEYNRLTALETDRARDFHVLFQTQINGVVPPTESLTRTLVQWRARGRLPFFEEETFTPSSWMQMLIGIGILPDRMAPLARGVDGNEASAAMAAFASELEALAARLPAYSDYLGTLRSYLPLAPRSSAPAN